MSLFRKKYVVIEAEQLAAETKIETLEGIMTGNPGDWLITGVNGERYPCKPGIFEKMYEPVDKEEEEEPETSKEIVIRCLLRVYRILTSGALAFGVIIGGLLAHNTLYYHTGLTENQVPLFAPCAVFFLWSFAMSFVESQIDWEDKK